MKLLEKACNDLQDWKKNDPKYDTLRYEIVRDVAPFYLWWLRKGFISRRMRLWSTHVEAYAKIKCGLTPPSSGKREAQKPGATRIDFVAGHLDILDRKFNFLLPVQALIFGAAIPLWNLVKDSFPCPLKFVTSALTLKSTITSFALVLFLMLAIILIGVFHYAGHTCAERAAIIATLVGTVGFCALKYWLIPNQPWPIFIVAGLVLASAMTWALVTCLCLRGAGRARWGEMSCVNNYRQARKEERKHLKVLIHSVICRSAKYRATMLLMFANFFILAAAVICGLLLLRLT